MPDQIIPIDQIRRHAGIAFADRQLPTACPYPEGSAARELWLQEYKQLHDEYYAVDQAAA